MMNLPQSESFHRLAALSSADQALIDLMPAGICVCDSAGHIVQFNRRAAELWERSPRVGETPDPYLQLTPLADGPNEASVTAAIRAGAAVSGMEAIIKRSNGSVRTVLLDISPLRDKTNAVVAAVICFHDISARKASEDQLRSHQDAEDFFENGAVALHLVGKDGTILRANRAELDLLGYSASEYIGQPISKFHADEPVINDILQCLSAGQKLDRRPARLRAKDGSIKHVQITSNVNFREGEFLNTRCFTVDITEQHRAEETLRERDRQAREILEAIPAAVYTTDAVGRVTFFNEATVEFSGRRPQLGSDEWCVTWRLYEPDGTPLPHDQCPMAVALKEGRSIRGAEAVAERPDGSRVPFIPFPTPLRDGSGAMVGAVNMLVDISARKQAENEQRALLNELNHRVKNTLATVQSIARQTFRTTPTPEQFISKFEGRLLALSKAHDLLTRRRWTGLEFCELLDAEFTPFTSPGSERIHLDGPEITLPPRVGLVLAMVVHELATNAAKYGALCRNEGHVYLRWRLTEREGAPRLQLQWREAHGPQVVTPLKRGFGSQIIERSITRDLGGEVRVDFDPAGLVCHAEFALGQ